MVIKIMIIISFMIIIIDQAGVMRRLRGSRDPWEQLGVARGANREEVDIIIIVNIAIIII